MMKTTRLFPVLIALALLTTAAGATAAIQVGDAGSMLPPDLTYYEQGTYVVSALFGQSCPEPMEVGGVLSVLNIEGFNGQINDEKVDHDQLVLVWIGDDAEYSCVPGPFGLGEQMTVTGELQGVGIDDLELPGQL